MVQRAARAHGEQQVAAAPPAPVGAGYNLAPTPAAPPATPPPAAAPSSASSSAAGVGSAEQQARVEAIRQQQACYLVITPSVSRPSGSSRRPKR